MERTAFVADSTLGLSPQEALERGIYLVPQQVILEGQSYRDYLEMTPDQVIQAQLAGKKVSTSQVSAADLEALYKALLEKFDRIVSVHVSSKLSGTYSTARKVAEQFGNRVKVIDGLTLNGGLSFVIEEVRRKLAAGVPWDRLEEAIAPLVQRIRGFVLPATLEYLHRGGRIGGLQHFIGSLLKLLPVLEVRDGLVRPLERARGWHRGLQQLAEAFHKAFPEGARVVLAHAYNPQGAEELRRLISQEGVIVEDVRACGPAVAAHTGPGTVALFAAPR
ncbi:DegV family protein [Meiothermus ruber]|jgi:DegV family protein with EDD domain|uniref:DegV family protein n=1 Tax=Meiothermus ruber (strain ATCC 35948 / DSM 1279 / VKM B-1258 / 21) TaxID=504728 RepID=D3PL55_MEIRD|nr:DegV family protein [Meiothermus ruber]ADD26951.1 degV family protein [Meiothermus ruber DSM 1279]AGK03404.1 DegV family protein [Meiothermus ruber DSM 1279]